MTAKTIDGRENQFCQKKNNILGGKERLTTFGNIHVCDFALRYFEDEACQNQKKIDVNFDEILCIETKKNNQFVVVTENRRWLFQA